MLTFISTCCVDDVKFDVTLMMGWGGGGVGC